MSPKLPVVSGADLIRALAKFVYVSVRQKGSHVRLRHSTDPQRVPVTVRLHKEIAFGTLRRILRDAAITVSSFSPPCDLRIPFKTHNLQFTIDKTSEMEYGCVASRRSLAHSSLCSNRNPRFLILLQTLCRSCKSQALWNQADVDPLRKIPEAGVPSQNPPSRISNLRGLRQIPVCEPVTPPSIYKPFPFISLQIAIFASPLFSEPSALPGVCGLRASLPPPAGVSATHYPLFLVQSTKLRMNPSVRRWKPVNWPKKGDVMLLYTSLKL